MELKLIKLNEVKELQQMAVTTFESTYGQFNTEDNMHKYISTQLSEDELKRQINDGNSYFYYIYYEQKQVGYIKLNIKNARMSDFHSNTMELERLYILPDYQGSHIGGDVIEYVKSRAKNDKFSFLGLDVWENNKTAIKFYKKHGFDIFGTHSFQLGNQVQKGLLMECRL